MLNNISVAITVYLFYPHSVEIIGTSVECWYRHEYNLELTLKITSRSRTQTNLFITQPIWFTNTSNVNFKNQNFPWKP